MPPRRTSGKQLMSNDLVHMTVDRLQQQLKARNLSSSGNKKALTDCLSTYLGADLSFFQNCCAHQHEPGNTRQSSHQCEESDATTSQRTQAQHHQSTAIAHQHEQCISRGHQCSPSTDRSSSGSKESNNGSRLRSCSHLPNSTTAQRHTTSKCHSARRQHCSILGSSAGA